MALERPGTLTRLRAERQAEAPEVNELISEQPRLTPEFRSDGSANLLIAGIAGTLHGTEASGQVTARKFSTDPAWCIANFQVF